MYGQFNNLVSLSYTKSKKERVIQRDHSLSEKCGETRGDKEERKEKKNGGRNKYNYWNAANTVSEASALVSHDSSKVQKRRYSFSTGTKICTYGMWILSLTVKKGNHVNVSQWRSKFWFKFCVSKMMNEIWSDLMNSKLYLRLGIEPASQGASFSWELDSSFKQWQRMQKVLW